LINHLFWKKEDLRMTSRRKDISFKNSTNINRPEET
jgi:hypothetical protein